MKTGLFLGVLIIFCFSFSRSHAVTCEDGLNATIDPRAAARAVPFRVKVDGQVVFSVRRGPGYKPFITLEWKGAYDVALAQDFTNQMPKFWLGFLETREQQISLTTELEEMNDADFLRVVAKFVQATAHHPHLKRNPMRIVAAASAAMVQDAPQIHQDLKTVFVAPLVRRAVAEKADGGTFVRVIFRSNVYLKTLARSNDQGLMDNLRAMREHATNNGEIIAKGQAADYLFQHIIYHTPNSFFIYNGTRLFDPAARIIKVNEVDLRILEQYPELVESVIEPLFDLKPINLN